MNRAGRFVWLTAFLACMACLPCTLRSQNTTLTGTVTDELTSRPVPDAAIRITGRSSGTSTDRKGRFSLVAAGFPFTLYISCLGYETSRYELTGDPGKPLWILLRPATYNLKEVEVSALGQKVLYRDRTFSVYDYELMDDHLILLVFRNSLKQSAAVLLSRSGDTLALSGLPEIPPGRLVRDFLSNVHYYSGRGYAYQCAFNRDGRSIDFLYRTPVDSLEKIVGPFLFRISGRLYFQESAAAGFGTSLGYISKLSGKQYIRKVINQAKVSEYLDDQKFYYRWNAAHGRPDALDSNDIESDKAFDFESSGTEGGLYGLNEARAHRFEFFNMIFPVFRLGPDSIAFFNFGSDSLEIMNPDGKMLQRVPISFHRKNEAAYTPVRRSREQSGWRWGTKVLSDDFTHRLYTCFLRNGLVKICRIDARTGLLSEGTILPFLFPEKIKIYRGEAFFLCRDDAAIENRKLVKCRVD